MKRFTIIVGTEEGRELSNATAILTETGREYTSPRSWRHPGGGEPVWTMAHQENPTVGSAFDRLDRLADTVDIDSIYIARVDTVRPLVIALVPQLDRVQLMSKYPGSAGWKRGATIPTEAFNLQVKKSWDDFAEWIDRAIDAAKFDTHQVSGKERVSFLREALGDVIDIAQVDLGAGDILSSGPEVPISEIRVQAQRQTGRQLFY
jgi:hypothetical protein